MSTELIVSVAISLVFGTLFLFSAFIKLKVSLSLVTGLFLGYFFFSMLPEIEELVSFPPELSSFKYVFLATGFVVIYVIEMIILQRLERKSVQRLERLSTSEEEIHKLEEDLEHVLVGEINHESLDEPSLRRMAKKLTNLFQTESRYKTEITRQKREIQEHVSKELSQLRFYYIFIYHLLVGIIGVGLLSEELVSGLIFFAIAWLISLVISTHRARLILSDLNIRELELEEPLKIKVILGFSALIGVAVGLVLMIVTSHSVDLRITGIAFSIVAGFLLYRIAKEVIPETEKGDIVHFLVGLISFSAFILLIEVLAII